MSLSFDDTQVAFQYRNNKELKLAHFLFLSMSSPIITKVGMTVAKYTMKWNLPFEGVIKNTVFKQFCGGQTLLEIAKVADHLKQFKVDVALDYGVEGKEEESDFDQTVQEFIKAIEYASNQTNIPFIPLKITGFARFALLEKRDSNSDLTSLEEEEWKRVENRIDRVCNEAAKHSLMVLIDAEDSWIQDSVDELANSMMEKYNQNKIAVFNTFQLYRHDRLAFLKDSHQLALKKNYLFGAKLVRGAYMEKERARAKELGYPSPIQSNKENTDKDYNQAIDYCLQHNSEIAVFIGTHNEDSCLIATEKMKEFGMERNDKHVFFSQLYGMSDNITFNLANAGYHASKYLPYGPVKDVIPYLLRRAEENSSVAGQTGKELTFIKKEIKRRGI